MALIFGQFYDEYCQLLLIGYHAMQTLEAPLALLNRRWCSTARIFQPAEQGAPG